MNEERIDAAMPDDDPAGDDTPAGAAEVPSGGDAPSEPDAVTDDIESLRAQLEQMQQQFLRARADYQNLERRAQEERRDFGRYQATALVLNFLPVLDDLQRALETPPGGDAAAWVEGVQLVEQKFRGVLEASGVTEIEAMGKPFDPELHEAVTSVPGPEGQVVGVTRKGYIMHERVIRPASVVVGSGAAAGK